MSAPPIPRRYPPETLFPKTRVILSAHMSPAGEAISCVLGSPKTGYRKDPLLFDESSQPQ
ncbi:MAG: hypothetical protein A4E40_00098 [Methanoregulaceae archaeon PtaU1.Bin059]|nr:MAG: hypothetical protein A4E39_00172 [Methanoregulaceae archaeon PtaB.Bin152]OPY43535.1 MAG: hypothetical protein A4E40_00098 [Methanoregulaceae archaeon PtaU1.Bin059]